jgi:glyoxylate utilization-related uncharacterized protein
MRGSIQDLPVAFDGGAVSIRQADWSDMTVSIETFPSGLDTRPIFKGLPDDRCQCPHWGYVARGRVRVVFDDREEVLSAGDAYYLPPGHTTVFEEDTELVEFSPRGEYARTMEVAARNVAAMSG